MSADNMVYLQRCLDGKWRAWHGFASDDCDKRPDSGYIVETESRADAIVAAHDWNRQHGTEYGVVEIEDERPPMTADQAHELPFIPATPEQRLALIAWGEALVREERAALLKGLRDMHVEQIASPTSHNYYAVAANKLAAIREKT